MKILVYTDSRGLCVGKNNKYIPYPTQLNELGTVEKYICPEKWTTSMDFLRLLSSKNIEDYDWVVLQTSVVENSPRDKSDALNKIYKDPKKKIWFDNVFGESNMLEHYKTDFGKDLHYEGKPSLNIFSKEMGAEYLVPVLEKIPNLIWISNNPLFGGNGHKWRGEYWKDRPSNMQIVNETSKEYIKRMSTTHVIDNTNWTDEDIKKYTFDNIHYTKAGNDLIFEKIKQIIL